MPFWNPSGSITAYFMCSMRTLHSYIWVCEGVWGWGWVGVRVIMTHILPLYQTVACKVDLLQLGEKVS